VSSDAPDGHGALTKWRHARLLRPDEFDRVFKDSERARSGALLVMARANGLGHARLGMVISKRVLAHAVDRNRARRRIRAVFQRARARLPACDFVVRLLQAGAADDAFAGLAQAFDRAGQRALARFGAAPASSTPTQDQTLSHG
jgi:ribonuclease P protein component